MPSSKKYFGRHTAESRVLEKPSPHHLFPPLWNGCRKQLTLFLGKADGMGHVLTHPGSRSSSPETDSHLAGKSAMNSLPWCLTITRPLQIPPAPFSESRPTPSFEKEVRKAPVRSNCPVPRSQSGHCTAAHSFEDCVRL